MNYFSDKLNEVQVKAFFIFDKQIEVLERGISEGILLFFVS